MKILLGIIISLIISSSDQASAISRVSFDSHPEIAIGTGTHISSVAAGFGGFNNARSAYPRNPLKVPEPAALLLLGSGLIGLASTVRRRRRSS